MNSKNDSKLSKAVSELVRDASNVSDEYAVLKFALEMASNTKELVDWFDFNSKVVFGLIDSEKTLLRDAYREKQAQLRKARAYGD
jgi:hypothetical protein